MRPEHVLEAKRWLKQARRDLEDARYCHEGGRYNIACFLAQQAAEKALKAYLYSEGEDPWGHSVAELVARCKEINEAFSRLASEAATLDKYYIPTRYPNGLPGGIPAEAFDSHDGERALQVAEQVIERVQQLGLAKGWTV